MNGQYDVLNPWAEADPTPFIGISPRLNDIADKKIGLLSNSKRASKPILSAVEQKLKERFPNCETSWYDAWETYHTPYWVLQVESQHKSKFTGLRPPIRKRENEREYLSHFFFGVTICLKVLS
jgi:hypothetical protein